MKPQILIIVEGGIVQEIVATSPYINVVVVDFDDQQEDPVLVSDKTAEIKVSDKLSDYFKGHLLSDDEDFARINLIERGY